MRSIIFCAGPGSAVVAGLAASEIDATTATLPVAVAGGFRPARAAYLGGSLRCGCRKRLWCDARVRDVDRLDRSPGFWLVHRVCPRVASGPLGMLLQAAGKYVNPSRRDQAPDALPMTSRPDPHGLTATPYACIATRIGRVPGLGRVLLAWAILYAGLLAALHPQPWTWLALAAPALLGLWQAWRAGGPGFRPGWTLQWHARGDWWLGEPGARSPQRARLLPGGLHHGRLTMLRFRLADGRHVTALLAAGSLPPAQWRRLRVRLGWPPAGQTRT